MDNPEKLAIRRGKQNNNPEKLAIRRGKQNGQSRETGNIWYTRQRKTKQKQNTICVGHHFKQANTNNVNKT